MYTPDRELNPPSYWEIELEPTKKEAVYSLLLKARAKIRAIQNSECLIYKLAGGENKRSEDIEFAELVEMRICDYYQKLD